MGSPVVVTKVTGRRMMKEFILLPWTLNLIRTRPLLDTAPRFDPEEAF